MLAVQLRQGGQLALSLTLGIFLLAGGLFLLMRPATAFAVDCTVTPGSAPYPSIKTAVNDVNCDTVVIPDGTHTENLDITRNLTLQGNGQSTTIIDGISGTRVITITGAVEVYLYDLRVTNGDATTAPSFRFGGGIYVDGATLHGQNLQIDNNVANRAASTGFGGGLAVQNGGAVYLTNTLVMSNVAKPVGLSTGQGFGGGFYVNNATFSMVNSQVMNNQANTRDDNEGRGGGLFSGAGSKLTLSGNTWQDNYAQSSTSGDVHGKGGAIAVDFAVGGTVLTITNDTFSGNIANASNDNLSGIGVGEFTQGGAIFFNTSNTGGQITATLQGLTLVNNVAKAGSGTGLGQGGAIYAQHATVRMTKSQLYNNHAANNGDSEGGGVYTREANGGSFTIFNSIFGGNTALGSGDGAAIYVGDNQDAMTISFVTIADDAPNPKTAIYFSGSNAAFIIIDNTIIANHAKDIGRALGSGATVIADYLLLFDNVTTATPGGEYSGGADNVTGDPLFTNAAGNDYHIQSGSAAIDSGDVSLVITDDIDGNFRPQDSGFDIGADEAAASLSITKSGPNIAEIGTPITYTLTVDNSGPLTATNLVITDAIPTNATYVTGSGGTLNGGVVSFTATSLAPGDSLTATFSVTSSQAGITNDDYRVTANGNISATGTVSVTTNVGIYLPIVLKN